jgi:hypothetical protein
MTAVFGISSDPWAFAAQDTATSKRIHPLNVADGQQTGSAAQCMDSQGDVISETVYDTGSTKEVTYEVDPGFTPSFYDTVNSIDFRLGRVVTGRVITSVKVDRNNSGRRVQIVITGENCPQTDTQVAKYTPVWPDSAYLTGGQDSRLAGITITKGKVISSSVTNTVQVAKGLDSVGKQVFKGVSAGRCEMSNELMSCTDAPAATVDADGSTDTTVVLKLMPSKTAAESNTGYPTLTVGVFGNLVRDT